MTDLLRWLRRANPRPRTLVAALASGIVSAVLALTLTTLSVSVLGLSRGRDLSVVFGVLIIVELIAFTRSPTRYVERRLAHRVGLGAVGAWRQRAARAIGQRQVDRWSPSEAAALSVQVTRDTTNLQALWLSVALPLITAVAGIVASILIVVTVLIVYGGSSLRVALWAAGISAVIGLVVASGARALRVLEEPAREFRRLDRAFTTALADVRVSGPALRLMGLEQSVRDMARAAGDARENAARRLRATETRVAIITTSLSLVAVAVTALWWRGAELHASSSIGRVELIASAMCTWAVIDLAGTVTRSVRQAVSVTAITERLDEWIESPEDVPASDTTRVNSPHEMICVTGPSGAGKTTFLASLAGITDMPPRSDVGGERSLAIWSRGQEGGVTWVPTDSGPLSGYARDVLGVSGELEARASQLLIALGLSGDLNGSWAQLSRGEAARAALVRALLHRRDIVVLDDPTSALDDDSAQRVIELLRREPGVIIVATHDERVIAHASSVWSIINR